MESVNQEAHGIIHGDRRDSYDHPLDNLGQTAELFTAFLRRKLVPGVVVTAEDVCWLQVMVKASRDSYKPKRDNRVDACGYIGCIEAIEVERQRRTE